MLNELAQQVHQNAKDKGTFEEEMADIIIRVLDMCAYKGIDIDSHVANVVELRDLTE